MACQLELLLSSAWNSAVSASFAQAFSPGGSGAFELHLPSLGSLEKSLWRVLPKSGTISLSRVSHDTPFRVFGPNKNSVPPEEANADFVGFMSTTGGWLAARINHDFPPNEHLFFEQGQLRKFAAHGTHEGYANAATRPADNPEAFHTDSIYFRCLWTLRGTGTIYRLPQESTERQAPVNSLLCFGGMLREVERQTAALLHRSPTSAGRVAPKDSHGRLLAVFDFLPLP